LGGVGVEEDLGGECAESQGVPGVGAAVDEVVWHVAWGWCRPEVDFAQPLMRSLNEHGSAAKWPPIPCPALGQTATWAAATGVRRFSHETC
jgi:hypothetical protein